MALPLRLLLAALLCAPSATACSLAFQPFAQPTWERELHYVEGTDLRRVDGVGEATAAQGFFLSYATAGGLLLVGGQDGLGADCSGTGWLRLLRGSEVLWEKAGQGRVWSDPDGPIALHGGSAWRLQGTELVALPAGIPADVYVQGWTPEGKPVYRGSGAIVVGPVAVPREDVAQFEVFVARNAAATGVAFHDGARATLLEVAGAQVRSISWPVASGFGGIAWADGWYVLLGGRVFLVRDGVTDLGVEAVSVGSQGTKAVVFSEEGYTLFEGTKPVAAARRMEGAWIPVPPGKDASRPVPGAWEGQDTEPAPEPTPTRPVLELPAPSVALALACLGLAVASRRLRRS